MEDPASKAKQLTANLQEAQGKVNKKKEENEAKQKQLKEGEAKINQLQFALQVKIQEIAVKKEEMRREKEQKQKAIEDIKKIISADKTALNAEKVELEGKITKLQEEATTLQKEKNELLTKQNIEVPFEETKKEESKTEEIEDNSLEGLTKDFKPEMSGNFLNVKSLTRIIDICTTLAGSKFKEQVHENRKKLRKNAGTDLISYLELASKELNQHTAVYQEIENLVLGQLKIEKKVLDSSIEYYLSQNNFEIISLMQMLGDKLRSFLTANKNVDKDTFKKILETKLEFIRNEADKIFSDDNKRTVAQKSFAHISGTYEQKEEPSIMVLKNYFEYRLGLEIYQKFEVEEEDVRDSSLSPDIQYDVEINQLMIQTSDEFQSKIPRTKNQKSENQ